MDPILDHLRRQGVLDALLVGRSPGASHDSYLVEDVADSSRRFAVRLQPVNGPFLDYDLEREARLLGALRSEGIPVPTVLEVDASGAVNGSAFAVLSWLDGDVYSPSSVARKLELADRSRLAERLVEMLARLHGLDWKALCGPGQPFATVPFTGAEFLFKTYDRILDALVLVDTVVLDFVRVWLVAQTPPEGGLASEEGDLALVHGDFRLANLVWQGDSIVGVLDWETAHIGDPLFDLAWICMGALNDNDLVMGLVAKEAFVEMYRKVTGRPVKMTALLWWQVAAAWVRGCTEARLLDLAATHAKETATLDVRDLLWEFGSTHTESELLSLIQQHDQLVARGL